METTIRGFTYDYSEFEGETREELAREMSYSLMCGIEVYAQIITQASRFMDGEELEETSKLRNEIMSVICNNEASFLAVGRAAAENPVCVLELPDAAEAREVFAMATYIDATMHRAAR